MTRTSALFLGTLLAATIGLTAAALPRPRTGESGQTQATGVIEGVVTGPNGPEAGVWVIAATSELPTRLVKIVVTDDRGRYLIPELPKASYEVWVRGYGLVDSPRRRTSTGVRLNLTAV